MRLEAQIIEDKLVEGFNELEEAISKLNDAKKYVGRIKNESRKEYATRYLDFLIGEDDEPDSEDLSFMEAQTIRMRLQELTNGLMLEAPIHAKGWTQASVTKFGKTVGKSPQEHGFFDACVKRMSPKPGFGDDKAKRFCASIKDASYGSAYWRGSAKPKKAIKADVGKHKFPKGQQLKKEGTIMEEMKVKCSRCGKVMTGKDEYDCEMKFNQHKCKGKRDLNKMPMDLLRLVAMKKMKEEDAWKEADKRNKK